MTSFFGTPGNDVANAAIGQLIGFTGGTVDELGDGTGDFLVGGDGEDFIFAANANDLIEGGEHFDRLNGGEGNDTIYAYLQPTPLGSSIGDEILGNIGDDELYGSNGSDTLDGGVGADLLEGNGGGDQLFGDAGVDRIRGGAGADTLHGGDGADLFFFNPGDVAAGEVIESGSPGSGDQIVVSGSVDFTAAADISNFTNLRLTAGATATFTAKQIDFVFGGLFMPDIFFGKGASETLRIEMRDRTSGIFSFAFTGADEGDNVLIVGDASSENIIGTGRNDRILGNGGNDRLTGSGLLAGGGGDDILFGSSSNDLLVGGQGRDTISWIGATAAIVFTLPESGEGVTSFMPGVGEDFFSGIENIVAGFADDIITGNAIANVIEGSAGRDRLLGGGGNDTLRGGEESGAGDLLLGGGAGADVIFGGGGNDRLDGGTENDVLNGDAGNDVLAGSDGNDTVSGGSDNDVLRGEAGRDRLDGGAGSDRFEYNAVSDSAPGAAKRDIINNFTVNDAVSSPTAFVDRLDLSTLDAQTGADGNQSFTYIGASNFTAEGQIRAAQSGSDTIVKINVTGTAGAELEIILSSFIATTLQPADFVL